MDLAGVYQAEYGRCVATLVRLVGDIGLAEEAVQDAFAVALEKWEVLPPNPGAWIVTTGCAGSRPATPGTSRPCSRRPPRSPWRWDLCRTTSSA
jgi:hypothetical protein